MRTGATAEITTESGTRTHRTRYLVDATGRDTLLGLAVSAEAHEIPRIRARRCSRISTAWSVGRENDAGNVSVYRFEHGWIWMIPLRDGCVSVGAVCSPDVSEAAGCSEGAVSASDAA